MSALPPDPPFDAKALGHEIARRRQEKGWSIDALARAAYVSRKTIVNIEQAHKVPRVDTLHAIAVALGTTPADLLAPRP